MLIGNTRFLKLLLISFVLFHLTPLKKYSNAYAQEIVGQVIEDLNRIEESSGEYTEKKSGDKYFDALVSYMKDFKEIDNNTEKFPWADFRRPALKNLEKTYGDYLAGRNSIKSYYSGFAAGYTYEDVFQPNESWSRLLGKYISGVLADKSKIEQAFVNSEVRDFHKEDRIVEELWKLIPIYCNGLGKFQYDYSKVNNTGDVIYHRCRRVSFKICGCPHHCHFCYIVSDCIMEIPLSYRPVTSSLEEMTKIFITQDRNLRKVICGEIMAEIKSLQTKSLTGRLYDYEGFVRR